MAGGRVETNDRGEMGGSRVRVRTLLRRACFGGSAALVALVLTGSLLAPADAQVNPEAGRPTAYIANAEATGTQVIGNTEPPQVVSEVLNARSPWTSSHFEAGGASNAFASLFDPGALVTNGASLICTAGFPCAQFPNFPPAYPLTARAANPLAVDSTAQINGDTVSLGPVSTTAGDARAHAGTDKVTATATVHGNALGSPDSVLVRIGSSTASNDLSFAGDGSLVATATAAVNDINVLGGALHIDAIESTTVSTSKPDGTSSNDVRFDITGATLAGTPVVISSDGLNIGGSPSGGDALRGLGTNLSPLLQTFRGSIRTLGTSETKDPNGASASVNGVVLEIFPNTDAAAGISPRVTMILGVAASKVYTYNVVARLGGGFSAPSKPAAPSAAGPTSFVPGTSGTPAVEIPGKPGGSPNTGGFIQVIVNGLLRGAAADRMKFFYLAWTLSMIGCALGTRLRPFRFAPATSGGSHA